SGYQRDLQLGKGALVHGFGHGLRALALLPALLGDLQWQATALAAAIEPSMFATDLAIELAAQGVPFRDAYRQVADGGQAPGARTAAASIAARVSPGACGALRLDALQQRLDTLG